jgi:alpha-tubulin suppressor-like RCC1 family protein
MKKVIVAFLVLFSINSMFSQCWKEISGGGFDGINHSLAIRTDGTLWAWGRNNEGQLGDGTTISNNAPIQIGNDTNWLSISAGVSSSVALKTDHTLWSWGDNVTNFPVQISMDSDWQKISCGQSNNFAIKTNGTLWTWTQNSPIPIQIGVDSNWKTISSNLGLIHAIKTNGTLWGWGSNYYGGIGDGTTINKSNPVQIGVDADWDKISNGEQCGFAIKTNGTLWAWGWNNDSQLGDGTTIDKLNPIRLGTDTDWSMISTKYHFTMALKNNNTLWMWGGSWMGNNANHIPTQLGTENNWSKITTGGANLALALKSNNTLWDFSQNPNPPTQISCISLNFNDFVQEENYLVYPNPAKSDFTIEMLNEYVNDGKILSILNPLGQLVFSTKINQKKINISIDKYQRGIYFIEIINKNTHVLSIKKIIFQ